MNIFWWQRVNILISFFRYAFASFFERKGFNASLAVLNQKYSSLKGGYLDFSHLTELKKNIDLYITEIYMKKQCKSLIIKNHKIVKKKMMVFP